MTEFLFASILLLLSSVLILYIYALSHTRYWKRRGIDGPGDCRPFSGHLHLIRKGETKTLQEWTRKHGSVYGIQSGWLNVLVVSDLEMLHELFVKKFEYFHGRKANPIVGDVDTEPRINVFTARGARWKRLRAIANPVFSVNNMKKIMPTIADSVRVTLGFLDKKYTDGEAFNILPYFHELAMDVISRVALGQKGTRQFRNEKTQMLLRVFELIGTGPFVSFAWKFPILVPYLKKFLRLTENMRMDPFTVLNNTIKEEIEERRRLREKGIQSDTPDFIDLFLDAESDDFDDGFKNQQVPKTFDKSKAKISKKITTEELTSQCFVFVLAGFDTTANAMGITFYNLAMNPDKQQRLYEEITDVCPSEEPVTYEQLNRLRYADAVMKESLRLVPIAAFASARQCLQKTTLGNYIIEEGTVVQADVLTVQHSKEVWGENAEEFHPERWLEESEERPPISWFPFGAGPRICIGMKLAYMEEKLALAQILRKYRVVKCEETEKELDLRGTTVLSPASVTVKLQLRD